MEFFQESLWINSDFPGSYVGFKKIANVQLNFPLHWEKFTLFFTLPSRQFLTSTPLNREYRRRSSPKRDQTKNEFFRHKQKLLEPRNPTTAFTDQKLYSSQLEIAQTKPTTDIHTMYDLKIYLHVVVRRGSNWWEKKVAGRSFGDASDSLGGAKLANFIFLCHFSSSLPSRYSRIYRLSLSIVLSGFMLEDDNSEIKKKNLHLSQPN